MTTQTIYAVEHGLVETDLDPRVRALIERMQRVRFVRHQHIVAIVRHTADLVKLRRELEAARREAVQP